MKTSERPKCRKTNQAVRGLVWCGVGLDAVHGPRRGPLIAEKQENDNKIMFFRIIYPFLFN